jgi:hypothetical protein
MEQIDKWQILLVSFFVPRDSASRKTFCAKPSFLPNAVAAQTCKACTDSVAAVEAEVVLPAHQAEEEGHHQPLAWRDVGTVH